MWDKLDISFSQPLWLLLLAIIPLSIFWYWRRKHKQTPVFRFPGLHLAGKLPQSFRQKTRILPFILRLVAITCIILGIARPQGTLGFIEEKTEGIDIMLCMDVSGSMLAKDFQPNRLEASKSIITNFIEGRPNDRIGLTIFEGQGFTQCPLTTDHTILKELVKICRSGTIGGQTAIGMGLATSVNRIRKSEAKSKVVILITDGKNLEGEITPETASDLAKQYGIRVYTIGVGTRGMAEAPIAIDDRTGEYVYGMTSVDIDEDLLEKIASKTGGRYYRAVNESKLASIFSEIDRMEKDRIKSLTFTHKKEQYHGFVLVAILLLLAEWLLGNLIYRQNP